ncbi:glycoside hydrolase family 31 protein [Aquimarina agarilytica]|uniref:glycoside hydrolase family 31 protein n=1 Tax=Aquimarina agarilytica TaxID=1087449 RepID=UPI0002894ADD|nr:TIM-barrel domain-containing protein [Aquimarina agarilytica]
MKTIHLILLLFSYLLSAQSQKSYTKSELNNEILKVYTTDGVYQIKALSEQIIETNFIPAGEVWNPTSHTVIPPKVLVKTTFKETENTISFSTKGIRLLITKKPFQLQYYYKNKRLISEKEGYSKTDSLEHINFNLKPNEVLYGGGSRALPMNRRGYRLELYNKAHYGYETHSELMNYSIPLVISSEKYMLHFDNPSIGFLDLDSKQNNTLTYETIGGRKTYQVIAGTSWKQLLYEYTSITGRQPLPPRWAFGNFASRFGYHSQQEVESVVQKFKKDSIPLDAVILDIYWFGKEMKGTMGNLAFLKDSFPTPKKMIADLKSQYIKTVLITEPFILSTSKKWKEAVTKKILATDSLNKAYSFDFYFGNTGLIDIFKPKAQSWFWDTYKKYIQMGVAGWWGDLGEPEVHPSDLYHVTGKADEVHNIYGHQWAKLLYNSYQKEFSNQRSFILMRAGYSGTQRYGMIPWSGDVNRSWGGLQAQPKIALQMGMQGLGYMHSDLGGFAGGETFDPELYIRWLQYGVFQPIFRPHAQEHIAPEPVFHDQKTKTLAKKAIELRYQLLPYNYTLAFENNQTGMPLMRPLILEDTIKEQNKATLLEYSDAYLWGNDLLVAPILTSGLTEKEIYFPKGTHWYNFYGTDNYKGGSSQQVKTTLEAIPIFVRGGAFIPMSPIIQTTEAYTNTHLKLHYYYDSNTQESSGHLYYDDGKTPEAYEKGAYELLEFRSRNSVKNLKINISNTTGVHFKSTTKQVELIVHNLVNNPKKVRLGNKKLPMNYTKETQVLTINFSIQKNETQKRLTIKF